MSRGQGPGASNRAARGRRRGAGTALSDKFTPSPGAAADPRAGRVRTDGTVFYHSCAPKQEFPHNAGWVAGYLGGWMGSSPGGTGGGKRGEKAKAEIKV